MLEVHSSYGIRYVNPWRVVMIEPVNDASCLVHLPSGEDRFYSLPVEEAADDLAERCAKAMARPFPKPSSDSYVRIPWVSRPEAS